MLHKCDRWRARIPLTIDFDIHSFDLSVRFTDPRVAAKLITSVKEKTLNRREVR